MIENRVRRIVAEQLNAVEQYVECNDNFKEDLHVSDIEMTQIIWAIEDEYKISIDYSQKDSLQTINDIVSLLKKLGIRDYPKFENLIKQRFNIENINEVGDPLKKMYLSFAMSTISRGENVKRIIASYIDITNKKYLDIGCAYGGFLVSFSRGGVKEAVGIDINEYLLDYSRALIDDCDIEAKVYKKDILDKKDISELGTFDIITCNDVIEHVDGSKAALKNIVSLLDDQGILFLEIPNRMSSNFIKSDGHFQLFGITILPKNLADEYYNELYPNKKHDVTYKSLNYYIDNLNKLGLVCEVIKPIIFDADKKLDEIMATLEDCLIACESGLPEISAYLKTEIKNRIIHLRNLYKQQYSYYKDLKDKNNDIAIEIANSLITTFGSDFWTIIARR